MYPSRQDLETRPQAVRRADSLYCLQVASEHRQAAARRRPSERDCFLVLARAALDNARRYDATARRLGFYLPGAPVAAPAHFLMAAE